MEDLKNIVATFVKKQPADIDDNTLINKRVVSGSILVHRMYAAINNAGYSIKEYNDINTYGDLIKRLNVAPAIGSITVPNFAQRLASATVVREKAAGIDIEDISNFPVVIDFREDDFYVSNFSMQEISYCILKGKPLGSFAGLFSTKEALCKTSERIRQMPFNKIEITHDDNGKPVYPGYSISISHTDQFAVAIAIANEADGQHIPANSEVVNSPGRYERKIARLNKMVLLALSIAVASAIVSILLLNRPA